MTVRSVYDRIFNNVVVCGAALMARVTQTVPRSLRPCLEIKLVTICSIRADTQRQNPSCKSVSSTISPPHPFLSSARPLG